LQQFQKNILLLAAANLKANDMSKTEEELDGRREISSRNTKWAQKFSRWLSSCNITPNQISIFSIVFSAIGGGALIYSCFVPDFSIYIALGIYILGIQLRLLCNLFDGMVAIEGNKKSANGDLYNDIPDRFSDTLLIVPVGYVAGGIGIELAWLAALLAVMTAYFRWLGAYKTGNHYFNGPMAKQHRMALLTICAVVSLLTVHWSITSYVFLATLIIMNIGIVITLIRRLNFISHTTPDKNEES